LPQRYLPAEHVMSGKCAICKGVTIALFTAWRGSARRKIACEESTFLSIFLATGVTPVVSR
ncbi:hypothetical protein, partial [Chloroflexus sp.]|uniref:hypothetical protein n=1 Tax=Chloroflexus sp. TaxID=1904827 RepID=UPI002FDAD5F5